MSALKAFLGSFPLLKRARGYLLDLSRPKNFDSSNYWDTRYRSGGNSGSGSYGQLAEFKNATINQIVSDERIASVIEFGCGDGNQLINARYPSYIGFDVSGKAVDICREKHSRRANFSFKLLSEYAGEKADLIMSLDVLYHLIEDAVFEAHMSLLFASSKKFVLIYSADREEKSINSRHVKTRKFSDWIAQHQPDWKLHRHIPNAFPFSLTNPDNTSISDFFLYKNEDEGKRLS